MPPEPTDGAPWDPFRWRRRIMGRIGPGRAYFAVASC